MFLALLIYGEYKEKQGRKGMYTDMLYAAGGTAGATLEVHYDDVVSIYHEASVCAVCHGG
jgi:hypothetical protein